MDYTVEQIKAAYALNLCTVSVSQIIDYKDINIMEQEYEAILNNLNLEQIPKDEALLKILKEILDTITYFRIEEGDKKFIEREYQQKIKKAIWAAAPNIGMIVAGGNPVTMAISLASQIGIGYMNYRKEKAELQFGHERELWELERTAIEQFNGLRRELFDTAWRLAAEYNFPDQLRLTERQISRYNDILMDSDLIRKYERLRVIQDDFLAYPPFWYHFGNTANAIARSDLRISDVSRNYYRNQAKAHFEEYRKSNQQGLLREDHVSAACALELADLLDINKENVQISELLEEAVKFSGRENDILQIVAIGYLRLNDQKHAAENLKQLVNEQYNTVINAQILSSMYSHSYMQKKSERIIAQYEILCNQVGEKYLYPFPEEGYETPENLECRFRLTQSEIAKKKYKLVFEKFEEKYARLFEKIVPVYDESEIHEDSYFDGTDRAIEIRKYYFINVFKDQRKRREYIYKLQEADIFEKILTLLNQMFEAVCSLEFMNESTQNKLENIINKRIKAQKNTLKELQKKIEEETFDLNDMYKLLNLRLSDFTKEFFKEFMKEAGTYLDCLEEMEDFANAEKTLSELCVLERLPSPDSLYGKDGYSMIPVLEERKERFSLRLLDMDKGSEVEEAVSNNQKMIELAKNRLPVAILNKRMVECYIDKDIRINRYFADNPNLKMGSTLKAQTFAIIDDLSTKNDLDLLFTPCGIVPVRNGISFDCIPYADIAFNMAVKKPYIDIIWKYNNEGVDLAKLYWLIRELSHFARPLPENVTEKKGWFGK